MKARMEEGRLDEKVNEGESMNKSVNTRIGDAISLTTT